MIDNKLRGFTLVEIFIVVATISLVLLAAFNFYKKDYVKVKIASALTIFEPIKMSLTEFRILEGDFRKLNNIEPPKIWQKLEVKNPKDITNSVSKTIITAFNVNKVQVLFCIDQNTVNIPKNSALGILYDGVYDQNQLDWECKFVTSATNKKEIEKITFLLPQNCRIISPNNPITCNEH